MVGKHVLAAGLAFAAIGFAPPAGADPAVLQGVYDYLQDGAPPTTWAISPTCVPVVGDLRNNLELPVGCLLHVTSTAVDAADADKPGLVVTGGDARLSGDRWSYTRPLGAGVRCPDGSSAKAISTVSFDSDALTGIRKTLVDPGTCGGSIPLMTNQAFTLVYRGPLPQPVEPYPLICEPGGLRRCF